MQDDFTYECELKRSTQPKSMAELVSQWYCELQLRRADRLMRMGFESTGQNKNVVSGGKS